jgi:excisionase family DNA binding protein
MEAITGFVTLEDLNAAVAEIRAIVQSPKNNYSEQEAAEYLGVSTIVLQRLRRAGKIGYTPVGGKYRYLLRHLEDYLEQNSYEPANARRAAAGAKR